MRRELAELANDLSFVGLGQQGWEPALARLARLAGGRCGELICFGDETFHIITGVGAEDLKAFAAARGHDPAVSSRVRVGLHAPEMTLLDESCFQTAEDGRRHREYGRILDQIDIPYAHLMVLQRASEGVVGLSVLSGRRQGSMNATQKRIMAAAAPHILSAVRLRKAAGAQAMALTAAGFDRAGVPVWILDRSGRPRAWSGPAEGLLERGDLRMVDHRLQLRNPHDPSLERAIARVLAWRGLEDSPPRPVRAFTPDGVAYLIEVTPLPSPHDLPFEAGALVLARPPRNLELRAARMAAAAYGLTPAESAVAGLLAAGVSAGGIAERQGVALGTIRTHIRRLLEKAGVRSQLELVSAIARQL